MLLYQRALFFCTLHEHCMIPPTVLVHTFENDFCLDWDLGCKIGKFYCVRTQQEKTVLKKR